MKFEFKTDSDLLGIHLIVFAKFEIRHLVHVVPGVGADPDEVRIDLSDDLSPELYFRIGECVGQLHKHVQWMFRELPWPLVVPVKEMPI